MNEFACWRGGTTNAALRFGLLSQEVPGGAVVLKAELRFQDLISDHQAAGVAGYNPETCVGAVGKAKQSWTGLGNAAHFSTKNVLGTTAYYAPIGSIAAYPSPSADVTSAVNEWMKNPASNHGLILVPAALPAPKGYGASSCDSGIGNVVLEIEYIAP